MIGNHLTKNRYIEKYIIKLTFVSFRDACENGHLHVAKLHETFEIFAFRFACKKGHLHVAKWLSLEMNASHSLST